MKLVTYQSSSNGAATVGILAGETVLPVANLLAHLKEDVPVQTTTDLFRLSGQARNALAEASRDSGLQATYGLPLGSVQLLAPVVNPQKVIGIGYNYRALCSNENVTPAKEPELFTKMPTSITGPFDPVVVPRSITKVDYEAELAVVMGRTCHGVAAEDALAFVGGYTVMNDVTAKIIPRPPEAGSVVLGLKGPDTFAPIGPCLVTTDEIQDPQDLQLLCRVNGEERQNFHSSDMVHSVAELIAYIAERITLHPGDIITTGTSLGIGIIQKPPVFLEQNDVVECEIVGIGTIRNRFTFLSCKD